MPVFSYQAKSDQNQLHTGEIEAASVAEAVSQIESRGWRVDSISQITQSKPSSTPLEDHYQAAIERKSAIVPALTALTDEMPVGKAKTELRNLLRALEQAEFASDLRHSKVATRWLPLLVTGFGNESNFRQLSDLVAHASQESEHRRRRRRQLAYPLLITILSVGVVLMFCAIVVPIFDSMFTDFGLQLPYATQLVVTTSRQMQANFVLFFLVIALCIAAIYGLLRLWSHYALTTRLFGFATSGNSANVAAMSRLVRQLAELLSIGVSVPDALWIAGHQSQHYYFKQAAEQLARDAQRGKLSQSSAAHKFPANMIHALNAGSNGQPNLALLRELSVMYSDRVLKRIDWSTGAIAQGTLVLVGLLVGFFTIALLAPLVSLISALS
jgi:type IV pilus assembly protein PilC